MSEDGLTLSAGEKKLLRSFFHRQMLPYAGIAAAAIAALVLLGPGASIEGAADAGVEETVEAARAPIADAARANSGAGEPAASRAWEKRQREAELLIAELRTRSSELTRERDSARERVASLEARLSRSAKRLDAIEERAGRAEARFEKLGKAAPAVPAAAVRIEAPEGLDVASLLERLFNIENRQQGLEERSAKDGAERNAAVKAVLDRLYELEVRTTSIEQKRAASAPASPATP